MATRKTKVQAAPMSIPEPGLHEELVGELEHGEKTAAQLAAVLGEDIGAVVDALVMLLSEGVVEAESGPVIYRVKGGAR